MNRRGFLRGALKGLALAPLAAIPVVAMKPAVTQPEVFVGHTIVGEPMPFVGANWDVTTYTSGPAGNAWFFSLGTQTVTDPVLTKIWSYPGDEVFNNL